MLSDRVPTSSHKQLGSVSELFWKGIFSEKTFVGFFPSSCLLNKHAIFKIWPRSTMSLMLLIHFPHSRTFCVQNATYNPSTETGIQHSVGFAVTNVRNFLLRKAVPKSTLDYFSVHSSEIIHYKQIALLSYNNTLIQQNSIQGKLYILGNTTLTTDFPSSHHRIYSTD